VADTDTLEGEVNDINGDGDINDIRDYVDGVAAYLVAEYGQFSFGAEYITALDDFRAGEMAYFNFAFCGSRYVKLIVRTRGFGLFGSLFRSQPNSIPKRAICIPRASMRANIIRFTFTYSPLPEGIFD